MTVQEPAQPRSFHIIGLPLTTWAFALRNTFAMLLALYVAFWLQLDGASSAATCVGILALPTRGQMLQKAAYRIAGTIIGVIASFVIAGLFNEVRDLLLAAGGAWISLCVFAAGRLDGNRAYGVVLSGYTVAIVTLANIDAPQDVFASGINRGAAIGIGILSITLASELFFTPDIFLKLLGKMEAAHDKVRAFAADTLRRDASDPVAIATLFGEITALRPDTTLLPLERMTGDTRSAAMRAVNASMIHEIAAARYAAATLASIGEPGDTLRTDLAAAIHDPQSEQVAGLLLRIHADFVISGLEPRRLVAASAALVLLQRDSLAAAALEDMRLGRGERYEARVPIWRSRDNAMRNAIRNFAAFAITTGFFVVFSNWPSTSGALEAFAAVLGISATNDSPPTVALSAVIAAPLAALMAGLTEFVLLDGADQFPLLVIATSPAIIGASLLAMTEKPKLASVGTLILILYPILLAPSNPQSYDAEAFLSSSLLVILALVLVFVCLTTILPTGDALRRRWILRSAWDECRWALQGKIGRHAPSAAAFRDADRIAQLGKLKDKTKAAHQASVRRALRLSDLASCSRRLHDLLANSYAVSPIEAVQARSALATLDPIRLRDVAHAILDRSQGVASRLPIASRQAVAELVLGSALMERYAAEVGELSSQLAPERWTPVNWPAAKRSSPNGSAENR